MATLHSTEFLMESVIRGHHVYKYIWPLLVRNLSAGLKLGMSAILLLNYEKNFRKWSKIFNFFVNKAIRKILIIRYYM